MAFRPDGRELVVVVAKGTVLADYEARDEHGWPSLSYLLLMADEFGEDPKKCAAFENDYAPTKHATCC